MRYDNDPCAQIPRRRPPPGAPTKDSPPPPGAPEGGEWEGERHCGRHSLICGLLFHCWCIALCPIDTKMVSECANACSLYDRVSGCGFGVRPGSCGIQSRTTVVFVPPVRLLLARGDGSIKSMWYNVCQHVFSFLLVPRSSLTLLRFSRERS